MIGGEGGERLGGVVLVSDYSPLEQTKRDQTGQEPHHCHFLDFAASIFHIIFHVKFSIIMVTN